MAIVTLAAVKAQLNIDDSDSTHDVELQLFADAVTIPIERELGRVVEVRTFSDEIRLTGGRTFQLSRTPVVSMTSLTSLDGTRTWDVSPSAIYVDKEAGRVTLLTGPAVTGSALALYQAGEIETEANTRLAALITIQHLWETQRGAMGVQLGGEGETWVPGKGFALPRRAIELLDSNLPGVA
ncbi:hypothetical protein [Streptomyces sp. NPDC051016]|uniref:hypothetical protein n=1 Tax=Streptomyces sp. NPDC051016 TaxID=3365638 RepID=UPI00378E8314